jgi:hypothetical protein
MPQHAQRGGRGPGGARWVVDLRTAVHLRVVGVADFSPMPMVSAIITRVAGSPVTLASSASQPSPNTLSELSG